ncbi:MAG: siroheme synthase [Firmicutes bacterium HGW-Firmicutes-16]|nr:MAG: siroheme synthase [Firmicutes bacterium HGW-Firmicutes-16]
MYFPFMVDLLGKKLVVVGGGKVAFRKCELFLSFGAEIDVVAPALCEDFSVLRGSIRHIRDCYASSYLIDAFAVIAATDNRTVNEAVYRDCCQNNIPINVVDTPELCSFYVPATLSRGDLTIGISTGGKSPSLAGKIKKELAGLYGEEYSEKLQLLGKLRNVVKEEIEDINVRRSILSAAAEMSNQEIEEQISLFEPKRGILR